MYSRSVASFPSQEMALRPRTWARPDRPGRTVCRIRCSGVMNTMSRTSWGRGPMTDISPLRILNASGSSSRLVERRNLPNLVSRTSSGSNSPFSSRSSVMERNL